MTEETAAFTATFKAGPGFEAPWLVIRGDSAEELIHRITAAKDSLVGPVVGLHQALAAIYRTATTLNAEVVSSPPAPPMTAPEPPEPTPPPSPWEAPPAEAPAPAQGVAKIEQNRWGASFEHGHIKAPMTPHGPAVLKRAQSKAGKPYARWIDPRSKEIPSVYASGVRQDPPDLWPGDFANGV